MSRDIASLAASVGSPGFTPSVRDVPLLAAMLATADDDALDDVERAIARVGEAALPALEAAMVDAKPQHGARLVRAIGRFAAESERAQSTLIALLDRDVDAKARRNAIIALGKARVARVEEALLAAWARETRVEQRRSLAASLGKVGGERSLAALRGTRADDAELARIVARATLMLERTISRGSRDASEGQRAPNAIDTTRASTTPALPITLQCRAGIEGMLAEELGARFEANVARPGRVHAVLREPIGALFAARTWIRFGFALPRERVGDGEDAGDAVVRAITSSGARAIFRTFTTGEARYRVDWATGGHRRAVVWRIAEQVARHAPELVNDPTESTWEVQVSDRGHAVDVELIPRAIDDPRFAYRTGDVPAASHPTIAAALARAAGVDPRDVVWDPFTGSGTELIERARLGPYAKLVGSDRDADALATARANLEAARVADAELVVADALTFDPPSPVSLIVTNPPMGRRVERNTDIRILFDRFIDRLPRVLAPRGRLVWLSPFGERTRARAESAGLSVELVRAIDMGGFPAELQRIVRRR